MNISDLYKPIEPFEMDLGWKEVPVRECGEELVSVEGLSDRIFFDAEYYRQGIPGAIKECYVRSGVAGLLLKAVKELPSGYSFLIYDAWRPVRVQEHLFSSYVNEIRNKFRDRSEDDIMEIAQGFVSMPSTDISKPSPHFTGGAVDLTIVDGNGNKIDMEAGFDSFCDEAHTRFFEEKLEKGMKLSLKETSYCNNRRLLYNIMTSVGFTNFPNEWWHFDYGNQFWGYLKKKDAIYGLAEIG